jgi:hypothetical protein
LSAFSLPDLKVKPEHACQDYRINEPPRSVGNPNVGKPRSALESFPEEQAGKEGFDVVTA